MDFIFGLKIVPPVFSVYQTVATAGSDSNLLQSDISKVGLLEAAMLAYRPRLCRHRIRSAGMAQGGPICADISVNQRPCRVSRSFLVLKSATHEQCKTIGMCGRFITAGTWAQYRHALGVLPADVDGRNGPQPICIVAPTIKGRDGGDSRGKYRRWLCTVYFNGMDINQHMIDAGHAKPYK